MSKDRLTNLRLEWNFNMSNETLLTEKNLKVATKEVIKLEKRHYYGEDNARDRLKAIRGIIDNNYKNWEEK